MAEIPVEELIRKAAVDRGVDPAVALRIAERESSLNPTAKNRRSSAYGLFQITDDTWKQYGGTKENRASTLDNIRIGMDIIADNERTYVRKFGRAPSAAELYSMHFLGRTGGPRVLGADPNAPVASVVSPKVVKANPELRNQTVGEFIASMQKKMGAVGDTALARRSVKEQGPGTVPMPQAPKETMRGRERLQPLAKDMVEQLGPNYQAALAAMALADTRDDDEDDENSLSRQYRDQIAAQETEDIFNTPQRIAGLELGGQSPFPEEQQPLMMADGGFVDPFGAVDTGPITADTRKALTTRQGMSAAEMMRMLQGVGREGVSNLESLARGSVSAVPGVVGDIESIFRDDKNRRFATSKEVERQYLPQRLTKPTKESEGFVELGTYIDPTIAKPVAKAAAKAGKALGPTAADMLQGMAPAAQPMYIVKPTGGTPYPAGMGSKIDDYLLRLHTGVTQYGGEGLKGKDAKKLSEFIDTKGRDFFTKRYASPTDQIREALFEGRISLTGSDLELFPKSLLHHAREGYPQWMDKLEETYDKATGMRGTLVLNPTGAETEADITNRFINAVNAEKAKLAKEGASPEEINLKIDDLMRNELGKEFGSSDAARELRKFLKEEKTPPENASSLMYAAMKGEPIYDLETAYPQMEFMQPNTVIPALASVVDDLDRMSFPEALIRGLQKTDIFRNEEAAIAREADGKKVPSSLFDKGVAPISNLGDFSLVQIKTPFAVRLEGAAMKHSIGNYGTNKDYGFGGKDAFLEGFTKVYSIRDAGNRPVVSMDVAAQYRTPSIGEIRSVFNSAPNTEEKQAVFRAFDTILKDEAQEYMRIGDSTALSDALPVNIYTKSREGKTLPKEDRISIDWWQEYTNYLKRKQNAD